MKKTTRQILNDEPLAALNEEYRKQLEAVASPEELKAAEQIIAACIKAQPTSIEEYVEMEEKPRKAFNQGFRYDSMVILIEWKRAVIDYFKEHKES